MLTNELLLINGEGTSCPKDFEDVIQDFFPQDDSWCGETECPAGHHCVHKCENGRCSRDVNKIYLEEEDCCNPYSVEQQCASHLECESGYSMCIPKDFQWEGVADSYFSDRCKDEFQGKN